jgi:Zn-dependent protease with chaperone function
MTREEIEAEIARLEALAAREPQRYRRGVILLALAGLALPYLLAAAAVGMVVTMVVIVVAGGDGAGCGALAFLLLTLPVLAVCVLALRALTLSPALPQGVGLSRAQAPALWEVADTLAAAMRAPPIHAVVLVPEPNAAIAQIPRLGLLGWTRNILIIGLPLLWGLSPEHFAAIFAHELGHLSRQHGRSLGWIYRTRRTWAQLVTDMERAMPAGSGLLRLLLRWYWPRLSLRSFVLCRQAEYEADQLAAGVSGARAAGEALLLTEIVAGYMAEHFWPALEKLTGDSAEPPPGVFDLMGRMLPRAATAPQCHRWLRQALARETSIDDTHPCVAERLAALGQLERGEDLVLTTWRVQPPAAPAVTAAHRFLGDRARALTAAVEAHWRADVDLAWRSLHAAAREGRRRLAALRQRAEHGHLTDQETLDQLALTERYIGPQAALPLAERAAGLFPRSLILRYHFGRLLLEAGHERGIATLEAVMQADPAATIGACGHIFDYLSRRGRVAEADRYLHRAEKRQREEREGERERDGLNKSDTFVPHGLDGELLDYLRERVSEVRDIAEAWLVRKRTRHLEDQPVIVLGVQPRKVPLWARWYREGILGPLQQKIRRFPHPIELVLFDRCPPAMATAIRAVPGARLRPIKPRRRL